MNETPAAWRYTATALLCAVLLLGGWLRLSGLGARSISHPEMYVPGIPLPDGLSEPAERTTVSRILTGTFSSDTHPPGYYLLMLPWTRIAGTSLDAIRLPSALFGLASIALIFWLGSGTGWPISGSLAAALLAFSGYHVFWSKVARMFALNCFLGLATTILLLLIARSGRRQVGLLALYFILLLAGMATHVFFWALFAIHVTWTLGNAWGQRALPDLCRAQLLALTLGSPLVVFAAYQSGNTVADLSKDVPAYILQFLTFAFALPTADSGFFPGAVPLGSWAGWALRGVAALIGAVLLANGLRGLWRTPSKTRLLSAPSSRQSLWMLSWITAAVIGSIEVAGFFYALRQLPPEFIHKTVQMAKVVSILPALCAGLALVIEKAWPKLPQLGTWKRFVLGENALLAMLAVGPIALLSLLSQFRPVLNQRGLLFAAPYLLLLLSIGCIGLSRKLWVGVSLAVMIVTCAFGLNSYGGMMMDPADYAQFAASVKPEIRPSDLIFIRKAWYETPILYYLQPDRYHLLARDFGSASAHNPEGRVWVVLLYDSEPGRDMEAALAGYQAVKTLTAPHAKAILYQR